MVRALSKFLKRHTILSVIFVIGLIYVGVTYISQEMKLNELKAKEELFQEQILFLQEEVDIAQQDLDKISSSESIEKLAREKLKMVRPNEIIYIIQEDEEKIDEDIEISVETE